MGSNKTQTPERTGTRAVEMQQVEHHIKFHLCHLPELISDIAEWDFTV